jgi:predicted dehydrogenase
MKKPVRLGIVGAGSVAVRGILPHAMLPDFRESVVSQAVCDPAPGRAQAAAAKFNVPQHFLSYEDLLAKGDVDAVTLCSPINLHYEQGKMAILSGKHVHFNKSMTTTGAEASELIELARKHNVLLVASPGEMVRPHNQYIKKMIWEGKLGHLCWAACGAAFGNYHDQESVRQGNDALTNIDPSWYYRKPGGGPLYDMTVYALHGLTGVLGPVKKVTAMSGVRIRERFFKGKRVPCDADDNSLMLLDFGDALFALAYGTAHGAITEHFTASYFGSEGSIVGLTMNGKPLAYPGWELAAASGDQIEGNQMLLPHMKGAHLKMDENHVVEDIMQLVDWVRDGKPTVATADHARHVINIIESAYRASVTGKTQDLSTSFAWSEHEPCLARN